MPQGSIDAVLAVIQNRSSTCLMVAIDGRSAAGKSTLANRLTERLPGSVIVRGDDFYRVMDDNIRFHLDPRQGYEQDFDWQRLRREALEPLRRGERARYRRYDWNTGRLGELAVIEPAPVVLSEGVYMTRPELRDLFDVIVWVGTPADLRQRRQVARPEDSPAWIDRWHRAEDHYVVSHRPDLSADLVASGTGW